MIIYLENKLIDMKKDNIKDYRSESETIMECKNTAIITRRRSG